MVQEELKATRVKIDGLFKSIGMLPKSREVALANTSAQLSKMWLGKALGKLGATYPYPESKDASTGEYIAPTADESEIHGLMGSTHIEQIKNLRRWIDECGVGIEDKFINLATPENVLIRFEVLNSYQYLVESGMWIGMELGRIRDAQ